MPANSKILTPMRNSKTLFYRRLSTGSSPLKVLCQSSSVLVKKKLQYFPNNVSLSNKLAHTENKQFQSEDVEVVIKHNNDTGKNKAVCILFGWAGANHKNLGKYSAVFETAGHTTVKFIMPTRYIFRDTSQVPELMSKVLERMEGEGLLDRPLVIHCLSDSGSMSYQGFEIASQRLDNLKRPKVQAVIWDSCPAPYPEVTLQRVFAFLIVNWICSMRDNVGLRGSIYSSYRLLVDRAWPNLIRKWKGEKVELDLMNGEFCGDFARDHFLRHPQIPELFLYSDKDFYLPYKYLEEKVLAPRREKYARARAVKFVGSSHVAHLKYHKQKYVKTVLSFINKPYVDELLEEEDTTATDEKYKTTTFV